MPRLKESDYFALSLCHEFPEGRCRRNPCKFSHAIVDTVRFKQIVGDLSVARSSRSDPLLTVCYPEGCFEKGLGKWEVKLLGGGRATLDGDGWSVTVQPQYPMQSQASHLSEALSELELRIFGKHSPVCWNRGEPGGTACMAFTKNNCQKSPCRYSHAFLDSIKVEDLVSSVRKSMTCLCAPPIISISCSAAGSGCGVSWTIQFGDITIRHNNLCSAFFTLQQRTTATKYHDTCTNQPTPPPAPVQVSTPVPDIAPPSYADVMKSRAAPTARKLTSAATNLTSRADYGPSSCPTPQRIPPVRTNVRIPDRDISAKTSVTRTATARTGATSAPAPGRADAIASTATRLPPPPPRFGPIAAVHPAGQTSLSTSPLRTCQHSIPRNYGSVSSFSTPAPRSTVSPSYAPASTSPTHRPSARVILPLPVTVSRDDDAVGRSTLSIFAITLLVLVFITWQYGFIDFDS